MSKGERGVMASRESEMIGGVFRPVQLLKREGGVETWRAVARDGAEVVVKTMTAHTISMRRLDLEVLDEIAHPGTAVPIRSSETESTWWISRPFVPGTTLREQIAREPASLQDVLAMSIALFDVLEKVHARGVVHGDIKPTNIVLAHGAWRTPVLVDFGFARHMLLVDALDAIPVEAVAYLAPEQSGLLDRRIDARADLYAVGLAIYEAIARPPFSSSSVSELLRAQLTTTPRSLSALVPGVPDVFDRIVQRLLRKDQRDRYQTAAGVRADLEELAAATARGESAREIVVGARDVRDAITEPAFTGRANELAAVTSQLDEASQGSGGIVLVEGESGSGKTWLIEEICRRSVNSGTWILRARGTAHVAQRPFHVLSHFARDIVASAPPGSERATRLIDAADSVGASIVEALPVMRTLFKTPHVPRSLDPNAEERCFASISVLLDALGSERETALLLVDDAQWADPLTLRTLERWSATSGRENRRVLVLLAFRSEDTAEDHPLRRLTARERVVLGRFSNDECRQQIGSMAGELPETAVQLVTEHAAGSPFLVSALLHGLVDSQLLVHGTEGWRLAETPTAGLQLSEHAADVVSARIGRLTQPARQLLSVGAVLGKTFDPVLAATLCSLAPRDAMSMLRDLPGGLVWLSPTGCAFVHDRIRDALLARFDQDERRRVHFEAAKQLPDDRFYDLAYHYDAAGEAGSAFAYALQAAESALAQHDVDLAERYFRTCVRGLADDSEPEIRFRVARGLGDSLLIRSKYEESARWFDEAARIAPSRSMQADVEERRAQLRLKQGNLPAAIEHGENALRLVGRYVPRWSLVCFLIVLWELLIQVLHTRFPRRFVGRRSLEGSGPEMFAIRVFNGLNGPYFFARGAIWVLWAHLRALNLCERYPATRDLGREYANHGSACAGFPSLFERAIRYTRRGAQICAELGDIWGQARALQFNALSLCATGQYRAAIEAAELGGRLFDRAGDVWNAQFALNWASLARYRMGDLAGCIESAKNLYERGKRLDSALGISFALDAWVRAVEGRLPAELVQAELARPNEHIQTWSLLAQSEAIRLLACDQAAEAEALLEKWLGRMKQERALIHESNVSMIVYLVAAQRRRAELLAQSDPEESARILARALRTSRRAVSTTRRFRNCIPHALRETALTEAMAGHMEKARSLIDASIQAATQLGAHFELALSREARGELGPAVHGTMAAKELSRARAELAALRATLAEAPRVTVSLIDRFDAVLEVGHQIAGSLVSGDVHARLHAGALGLLRAQGGAIIDADENVVCGDAIPISGALVSAASELCQPIVWSQDAPGGIADDALVRSGIRSVLCAPIAVHGDIAAFLYVTHSNVGGALGGEERRIAAFLAALAGVALENAGGFAELERRVEARTAELAAANSALADNLHRLQTTQEQLVHAGRMAAVGTLIAGLSHELNNPLTVILGNIEHLEPLPFPDQRTARMIEAIARNGKRVARLVDTLLRFSRTKSMTSDKVMPEDLVHEVVQLVAGEARTRQVELRVAVDDDLPPLVVARHDIASALVNIATNALQATPAGGRVELSAAVQQRDEGEGVCFSIRDTGTGIAPDALTQIFDPFFTTKPEGEGTGLGLSLARQAATAHGGLIDVETFLGTGTTMRMWLPSRPGS